MKVTEPPIQKGFADGEIETLTERLGFTVIVTWLLIAGFPIVQVSEEVSLQVITSLFKGI